MDIKNIKCVRNYRKVSIFILILILICITSNYNRTQKLLAGIPPYPVKITNIIFVNGIGRGPTSPAPDTLTAYYRGYGQPGTRIVLTADMNQAGVWGYPMYGDVMFTVTYTSGTNTGTFTATMSSGSNTCTAAIPYDNTSGFSTAWITAGSTTAWTYSVTNAAGDYVSSLSPTGISQIINWNYNNPPAPGTTPNSLESKSVTQTSFTLYWDPIDTSLAGHPDFYEYRVYYKKSTDSVYKLWNGSNDPELTGLVNNPFPFPVSDPVHHFDSNGWKYTTINNLSVFTVYDFYITAVDVFGNEVTAANAWPPVLPAALRGVQTLPYSVILQISDGITTYTDFTNLAAPGLRPLRETNTAVTIYAITSGQRPDECNIWFAPVSGVDMITNLLIPNTAGLGANLDSVAAVYTGPNQWTAYLPTIPSAGKNQIIATGTDVRFIIELKTNGVSTFIDRDSDTYPFPTEWTYQVGVASTTFPKPVCILNNVITNNNPRAYPCYYLTEDAIVSITVIDVKSNIVQVLLDNAYRRGGENIKENGWSGTNKYGNKLGTGMYYVRFYAKGYSSGSIILDYTQQVVINR